MKKIISVLIAALVLILSLTSCGTASEENKGNNKEEKINIVTTIFPEYDWVREVLGDKAENFNLTMLLDTGVDLHSFQPTVEDIMKISNCDLFIFVGGESDEWAEDALAEAVNEDMKVINLLEVLGSEAKEEEIIEGMEGEEEAEGEEEEEGPEYDEHVWLSLKNAEIYVSAIADVICELDQENADTYKANADAYKAKLSKLDEDYQAAVSEGSFDTLLFGDRFPFRYMVDDYNLDYYAAFIGCSAETEASFETITFLAGKTDELGLRSVIVLEGSDKKIAETVISNTKTADQQIVTLDSMQSVTSKDVEGGATYISIMEDNLSALKDALK